MRAGGLGPLGGEGKIVEADETYYGPVDKPRTKTTRGRPYTKSGKTGNKRPVLALVERGGNVRTFHVPVADKATVTKIVRENIVKESRLHTDESRLYFGSDEHFKTHETVKHSIGEYVRGDIHTNSAEGYFGIFKRSMRGIYQHCKQKHLHRSWRSSISATTTASVWVSTMGNVQHLPSGAQRASGSRIVSLTKRDFRPAALRFLRWRKKRIR